MIKLPEQFEKSMQSKLAGEFPEFLGCLEVPSPTSIRVNPNKAAALVTDNPVLWCRLGKYLDARPTFTLDPLFHAGTYYVQEASSMFVEQAIRQTTDLSLSLNVLDLCAAPGGKSTHILSLLNENSLLVSNEVIRARASILAENIQKWGYPNCIVTNNDPKDFQAVEGFFDVMVVDAPCSGEGLFRKDPQAMEEWSPQNVALCSSRQKRILADVWPALRENGILIYCTCTYNESENEENLLWLQQQHEVEFLQLKLQPEWNIEEIRQRKITGYRFFPHRVKGEGFFISVIRKKETQQSHRVKAKTKEFLPTKKLSESVTPWIRSSHAFIILQHHDDLYFLPGEKFTEAGMLYQHLRIVTSGTSLASIKQNKLIPAHALAMSIYLEQTIFPSVTVDHESAIRYLRRDAGPLDLAEAERGFHLIRFENIALGWINNIGNRYNNLYPQEWRIRMAPR
jgi:16S rRNA C967 or C1407 C5-methylase (RsmB/RsmF family)/NOL1/NOP2/fmu family ribosome biogenesis protein